MPLTRRPQQPQQHHRCLLAGTCVLPDTSPALPHTTHHFCTLSVPPVSPSPSQCDGPLLQHLPSPCWLIPTTSASPDTCAPRAARDSTETLLPNSHLIQCSAAHASSSPGLCQQLHRGHEVRKTSPFAQGQGMQRNTLCRAFCVRSAGPEVGACQGWCAPGAIRRAGAGDSSSLRGSEQTKPSPGTSVT